MSKIDGIKLNGNVLEIETGSNVDIHIEDDTLVINTNGTSSGGGGGSVTNTIKHTAEIECNPEGNWTNINSALVPLLEKLDISKEYIVKINIVINTAIEQGISTTHLFKISYSDLYQSRWVMTPPTSLNSCNIFVGAEDLGLDAVISIENDIIQGFTLVDEIRVDTYNIISVVYAMDASVVTEHFKPALLGYILQIEITPLEK
jgi:hypothetical protein